MLRTPFASTTPAPVACTAVSTTAFASLTSSAQAASTRRCAPSSAHTASRQGSAASFLAPPSTRTGRACSPPGPTRATWASTTRAPAACFTTSRLPRSGRLRAYITHAGSAYRDTCSMRVCARRGACRAAPLHAARGCGGEHACLQRGPLPHTSPLLLLVCMYVCG
jgi:hypothetical protein